MSSKVSTPTRNRTKTIQPCENVEQEFTRRFLTLFTSFYDTPSTEEIVTFPPVKTDESTDVKSPTRVPPFHSGVWDLRLKKAVDARLTADQITSNSLSEQVLQLRESLASEPPDLNDVFIPSKASRPEIPLYLQNLQKEEELIKESFRSHTRAHPLDLAAMAQQFTQRLNRQKALAKERRQRRFMRVKEVEKQHMDFVATLHKSKLPEEIDIKSTTNKKKKEVADLKKKQIDEGKRAVQEMREKSPKKSPMKSPTRQKYFD